MVARGWAVGEGGDNGQRAHDSRDKTKEFWALHFKQDPGVLRAGRPGILSALRRLNGGSWAGRRLCNAQRREHTARESRPITVGTEPLSPESRFGSGVCEPRRVGPIQLPA